MQNSLGIFFALGALLSWGFGDFFIQRTVRAIGTWKALLLICATTTFVLFPFVVTEFSLFISNSGNFWLLSFASLAALVMAVFDFEAFKRGKLAIVEPIISFELPLTIALSVLIWHERLQPIQSLLVFVVFCGILLSITVHEQHLQYHKRILEKGVVLALIAAIGSALSNFFIGASSQEMNPLVTIWFVHTFLALVSVVVILMQGGFRTLVSDVRKNYSIVVSEIVFDNAGWLAFAAATTYIPIAIATTISESYIALAVLLGIFVTKEKLQRHQFIGVILAMCGVIILSIVTSR